MDYEIVYYSEQVQEDILALPQGNRYQHDRRFYHGDFCVPVPVCCGSADVFRGQDDPEPGNVVITKFI